MRHWADCCKSWRLFQFSHFGAGKSSYKTPKGGIPAWVDGNVTSMKVGSGAGINAALTLLQHQIRHALHAQSNLCCDPLLEESSPGVWHLCALSEPQQTLPSFKSTCLALHLLDVISPGKCPSCVSAEAVGSCRGCMHQGCTSWPTRPEPQHTLWCSLLYSAPHLSAAMHLAVSAVYVFNRLSLGLKGILVLFACSCTSCKTGRLCTAAQA